MDLERYFEETGDLKTKEMIRELKSTKNLKKEEQKEDQKKQSRKSQEKEEEEKDDEREIGYDRRFGALKTEYEECCDILGVKITDSKEKIRKRFKTLALQYHPDKNGSEEALRKFIEIRKAYEYLTNQE